MDRSAENAAPWWRSTRVRAAVVLLVAVAVGLGVIWQASRLPGNAAYRLDDTVVTSAELRREATAMRALYGIELPEEATRRAAFWRDLAKSDALAHVLAAEADRRKLGVSSADGEQALSKFVEQAYGPGADGEKAFADALVTAGTSRKAVVKEVRRQLLTVKLYDEITEDIVVASEAETKAAYERWSCHFGTPERRRLRNIVVLDEATARKVREGLDGGGSWSAAVRSFSKDEKTRGKDGDLGLRRQDEFEKAYGRAAFGTRKGAYFGPVKTAGGWNVGVIDGVVARVPAAYGKVKSAVALADLNQRKSKTWRSWISSQLRAADVEYADRYRPKQPFAAPDGGVAAGQAQLDDCTRKSE